MFVHVELDLVRGGVTYDFVFVGGGLSAALAVLALQHHQPQASIALVESAPSLGGNHTWCFHARDVPEGAEVWLEPLVVQRWPGYSVRFPRRSRRLSSGYACISSARLSEWTAARCRAHGRTALLLSRRAVEVRAHQVELSDGETLEGRLVIDARGPEPRPMNARSGYQKFVGLELEVAPGHALREPLLIDATLPQRDGFRFMYALPFGGDRVLIEDTYFSAQPGLYEPASEREIARYAAALGLSVRGVARRECGVLPMPSDGDLPRAEESPIRAGYRGGFFHPVTGYSVPIALRFAEALAHTDPGQLRGSALSRMAEEHAAQLGFLRRLTHMMFGWFRPETRFSALEHFYRLPEAVIERFYAAQLTRLDRLRLFWGAPPRGMSLRGVLGFETGASS